MVSEARITLIDVMDCDWVLVALGMTCGWRRASPCVRFAPRPPYAARKGRGNGVLCFSLDSGFRRNDGVRRGYDGVVVVRGGHTPSTRFACARPFRPERGVGRTLVVMTAMKAQAGVCNVPNRTIFEGDNLDVMRGMNDGCVDLIYLDPPFNSNRDYAAPIGSEAAGAAFKDTWDLTDVVTGDWGCGPCKDIDLGLRMF